MNTLVAAWGSHRASTGLLSSAFWSASTLAVASGDHLKGSFPVKSVSGFAIVAKPFTKMRWNPATPRKACTSFLVFKGGFYLLTASSCVAVIETLPWDNRCPRNSISVRSHSHFLRLTWSLLSWSNSSTLVMCTK